MSGGVSSVTNGVWYTTWNTQPGVMPPIPQGVNLINLFVGELDPTQGVAGLESAFANPTILKNFIAACNQQGIKVVVSIGGNGGSYDNTWDQLTSGNVNTYANALVNFCNSTGVSGIDFDWEPPTYTQSQGNLVGQLIGDFKNGNPNLQASLCVNSGSSWETQAGWVFQSAKTEDGSCAIDRLNIMAYYPLDEEKQWIAGAGGWENWVKQYGLSNSQITVGMLSTATDLQQFAEWDDSEGFSTSLWNWNAAQEQSSNASSQEVWNIYHPGDSA